VTRDEADAALRRAIVEHAQMFGLCEPDELLSDYVVIVHWSRVEADQRSRYTCHFATQEDTPTHIAVGFAEMLKHFALKDDE
jgi:hypothetical protein